MRKLLSSLSCEKSYLLEKIVTKEGEREMVCVSELELAAKARRVSNLYEIVFLLPSCCRNEDNTLCLVNDVGNE